MIAIKQLYIASDFNSSLKYFCGYWETTKKFLSNIFSNEITPDENFPGYGMFSIHVQLISDRVCSKVIFN